MATETPADEINSMLDRLVKVLKEPTASEFNSLTYKTPKGEKRTVFVYPQPVRATKAFRGYVDEANPNVSLTDNEFYVVNLDLPRQLALFSRASDAWGIPARHGDLRENIEAVYGLKEVAYRTLVLDPFWIYTGQMAAKSPEGNVDVRRAIGAKFVDEIIRKPAATVAIDEKGKLIFGYQKTSEEATLQIRYVLADETLQTSLPTREGYFDNFSGAVPVDSDLKEKGIGRWYGTHFEDSFSAVGCDWRSGERVLEVAALRPSRRSPFSALPIFADSLKK